MSVHPSILLDHLGLPHAAAAVDGWLDRAAKEELSYADCLEGVLEEEVVARKHAAALVDGDASNFGDGLGEEICRDKRQQPRRQQQADYSHRTTPRWNKFSDGNP